MGRSSCTHKKPLPGLPGGHRITFHSSHAHTARTHLLFLTFLCTPAPGQGHSISEGSCTAFLSSSPLTSAWLSVLVLQSRKSALRTTASQAGHFPSLLTLYIRHCVTVYVFWRGYDIKCSGYLLTLMYSSVVVYAVRAVVVLYNVPYSSHVWNSCYLIVTYKILLFAPLAYSLFIMGVGSASNTPNLCQAHLLEDLRAHTGGHGVPQFYLAPRACLRSQ